MSGDIGLNAGGLLWFTPCAGTAKCKHCIDNVHFLCYHRTMLVFRLTTLGGAIGWPSSVRRTPRCGWAILTGRRWSLWARARCARFVIQVGRVRNGEVANLVHGLGIKRMCGGMTGHK